MLVARKEQYYESAVPKIHEVERPQKHPVRAPEKKKSFKIIPIFLIAAFFTLSIFTVSRYVNIFENDNKIAQMEEELNQLKKQQDLLRVEIMQSQDLEQIDKYAKNELGMDYPNSSQVKTVKLPEPAVEEEPVKPVQKDEGIFNLILSLLD